MKKLVVIGGGFAGCLLAKKLQNEFDLTLIDTKDFFEYTPGILRVLVEPEHEKKLKISYNQYLKKIKIIKGLVKEVSPKFVLVNNKQIQYDYLVISTGSRYQPKIKDMNVILSTTAEACMHCVEKIKSSKSILIVGGGLVGVELAGEITDHYKNKQITIVQSPSKLIERNPKKAQDYAEQFLKKRNVKIIYNERVIDKEKDTFVTTSNTKIQADICFLCVGITPNSELIKKHFKTKLDSRSHILTNQHLQMESHNNIFILGDVNNIPEEKTGQAAEKQVNLAIKNLRLLSKNKTNLYSYKAKSKPLIISLGKYNGIFIYKNFVLTGLIPAFLKYLVEKKTLLKYKF